MLGIALSFEEDIDAFLAAIGRGAGNIVNCALNDNQAISCALAEPRVTLEKRLRIDATAAAPSETAVTS
ncbi:MAG TPA: hypothetical protein VGO18_00265 [Steroidobacteraceae bacterium]|jgi:hypothetical protein|nr:hypothetical protein [Steroidobacteraceae bacterium]